MVRRPSPSHPAEFLHRQTGVPDLRHVADPVAFELHYIGHEALSKVETRHFDPGYVGTAAPIVAAREGHGHSMTILQMGGIGGGNGR